MRKVNKAVKVVTRNIKLSQLINELQKLQDENGDLLVFDNDYHAVTHASVCDNSDGDYNSVCDMPEMFVIVNAW